MCSYAASVGAEIPVNTVLDHADIATKKKMQVVSKLWGSGVSTCKIQGCKIYDKLCQTESTDTKLSIVKNGEDFEVHGDQNIAAGYELEKCIICYGTDGTELKQDEIKYKQNGKPCNFAEAVPALTPTVLGWKNSAAYFDILDLTQFWTSSESTCSISQCEIR